MADDPNTSTLAPIAAEPERATSPTLPPPPAKPTLANRPLANLTSESDAPGGSVHGSSGQRPAAFATSWRRRGRRWPWALVVLLALAGGAFLIFGTDEDVDPTDPTVTARVDPVAVPTAGVGSTQSSGGFEITLVQAVDPWIPANEVEVAREGRRLVAVELAIRNAGPEDEVLLAQTMTRLGYDGDRIANFAISLLELVALDGAVETGGTRQGWVVFELPADAAALVLEIRGSLLGGPVSFTI